MFDCTYSFSNLFVTGFVYQCRAVVANSGSATAVERVTGAHLFDNENKDVAHLYLQDQNVNRIPTNLGEIFPNLEAISWYNSKLTYLSADDLKPFPSLTFFGAWMNQLTTLEDGLFRFTRNLGYIDFDNNLLENVSYDLLDGLENLEAADFSSNTCIDFYADTPESIEELKTKIMQGCSPPTTTPSNATPSDTTPSPTTPGSSTPQHSPCENIHSLCLAIGSGRIGITKNCKEYYVCHNGSNRLLTCDGDLLFDVFTEECESPDTARCADTIDCD